MKIISINIGAQATLQNGEKQEITGIYKRPVSVPVFVSTLGLAGDFIGSPKHHGGPDQAVYVYGAADYQWWETSLGTSLEAGTFGENLTIGNLRCDEFNIGDFLHIGEVQLQVTAPRFPCGTFASRMQVEQWVKKFRAGDRPGFYCRVLREGMIAAGDAVVVEKYAGETLSLIQMYRDHYEKDRSRAMILRNLNAPIASRPRVKLEEELEKL